MTDQRPLVCPILVGRDDLLALAARRRAEARAGHGALLFLAGEAGIGKSRMAGAVEQAAIAAGFALARGATYPGDLELAGGVLLDLARSLRRQACFAGTGEALEAQLDRAESAQPGDDDLHRRRRILVLDVVDRLAELPTAAGGPVLLVLEDLHWTDGLSLEVLAGLARRLPELPLMVLATYRSDELFPSVPMRDWRARLLAGRLAEEVRLARLDREGTAAMARALLATGMPVGSDLVDAVHDRSDGVPLHVEELLALVRTDDPGAPPAWSPLDSTVPQTLEHAILARAAVLSPRARRAADAAAVIGRSFALGILADVLGRLPERLAPEVAELERTFFVTRTEDQGRLDFRHAVIRDALYAVLPEPTRRRLHARVADATVEDPRWGPAFRSIHLELAGRETEAFEAAMAGARAATELSAHREARELLERARRTAPAALAPERRAAMLAALAHEATATDDNAAADRLYTEAASLYEAVGAPLLAAALVPAHVGVRHLLGDGLPARTARLQAALTTVEGASPDDPGARGTRTALLGGLAATHMLARELEAGIAFGDRGRRLATEEGDVPAELDIAASVGSCLVFAGQMDDGWAMLEDAVLRARARHLEAQASRAYRMIGSCASVLVEYGRAEHWLREGIAYTEHVELWNHRHYMASHLAHVQWATGDWVAAEQTAGQALADGRGGITTRITALHVLGHVALGRGDLDRARHMLEEALALAEPMAELQRLAPAFSGLAEVAWLAGDAAGAVAWTQRGAAASDEVGDAAYRFPLLVTGTRARLARGDPAGAADWVARGTAALERRGIPGTLPAIDHAHGLLDLARGATGHARDRLDTAAGAWRQRRRAWDGAWAALDLANAHARGNRPAAAARLAGEIRAAALAMGAVPLVSAADTLLRRVRARGVEDVPWAPLTGRELEVARAISRGGTNAAIAAELGVSPRTVTSHVEHILAKLGMTRRAEIAAWVVRVVGGAGTVPSPPDTGAHRGIDDGYPADGRPPPVPVRPPGDPSRPPARSPRGPGPCHR